MGIVTQEKDGKVIYGEGGTVHLVDATASKPSKIQVSISEKYDQSGEPTQPDRNISITPNSITVKDTIMRDEGNDYVLYKSVTIAREKPSMRYTVTSSEIRAPNAAMIVPPEDRRAEQVETSNAPATYPNLKSVKAENQEVFRTIQEAIKVINAAHAEHSDEFCHEHTQLLRDTRRDLTIKHHIV